MEREVLWVYLSCIIPIRITSLRRILVIFAVHTFSFVRDSKLQKVTQTTLVSGLKRG